MIIFYVDDNSRVTFNVNVVDSAPLTMTFTKRSYETQEKPNKIPKSNGAKLKSTAY